MGAILRLGLALILFCASLLAVFPAPTYNLWKLSIGVTEWGHFLALAALLVLLPGWRRVPSGRVAALLGVIAICLALSSLLRAIPVGGTLPERAASAFGAGQPLSLPGAVSLPDPLSLSRLVRGTDNREVRRETLTYVVRDGKPLELDLYRRDRAAPSAPLVITIHGGSWRGGSRRDLPELNSHLAARGYVVASLSYRFAPEFPHPAATDDVNAAIEYLKANASGLGVDQARIALIGRSAGGQLALLSAYTKNDPSIRGVVAFYPPTDQNWGYVHPTNPRVINSTAILEGYLAGNPSTAAEAYRTSSPLNYVGPRTVPTLLIHGTKDEIVSVRQSARLDSALAAAGRPHLFLELPWATHGCDFNFRGPCAQLSTWAIERFLASVLSARGSRLGHLPRFFLSYDPGLIAAHFRSVSSSSPRSFP